MAVSFAVVVILVQLSPFLFPYPTSFHLQILVQVERERKRNGMVEVPQPNLQVWDAGGPEEVK